MTEREYRQLTLVEMQKRRWRLTRECKSYGMSLPVGMEVQIHGKRDGLNITAPKCEHCGVCVFMRGLMAQDVEEILEEKEGESP